MMARADEDFLDDYFSFMQTKRRELTSLYNTIAHRITKNAASAEEVALKKLEDRIGRNLQGLTEVAELSMPKCQGGSISQGEDTMPRFARSFVLR